MFGFSKCFFGFHNWNIGMRTLKGGSIDGDVGITMYCRVCDTCGKIQYKDRWGDWENYNYKPND